MRAIYLMLLFSSACSLALDVDDLRNPDGGGSDVEVPDAGVDGEMGDGDVEDAGLADAPPLDTPPECDHPVPMVVPLPDGFLLRIGDAALEDVAYEVTLNGMSLPESVTIMSGTRESTPQPVGRLGLYDSSFIIRDPAGCMTPVPAAPFVETLRNEGGAREFYLEDGPSMDIADDGTVIFADASLETRDSTSDVYLWAPGTGAIAEPVARGSDGSGGLTAVRISDNARAISYWERPSGGERAGQMFVNTNIFSGPGAERVGPPTESATSDLRCDNCDGSEYHFAMRVFVSGPETIDELISGVSGAANLTLTLRETAGRSPFLFVEEEQVVTAFILPTALSMNVGYPSLLQSMGMPSIDTRCEVNARLGLVATDGTALAFVSGCGTSTDSLYYQPRVPRDPVRIDTPIIPEGLISASKDFSLFLLRVTGSGAIPFRFMLLRGDPALGELEPRLLGPQATVGVFLEQAAISPDGGWVVYAIPAREPVGTPPNRVSQRFNLARARVR